MTAQVSELTAVVARLEKVERQNRRLRGAGIAVLVLAAAGLLMGQALPRQRTVEAEEFLLRDANGRIRASLSVFDGDPGLSLIDQAGKLRAGLSLVDGDPLLNLKDEAGKSRASLSVFDGTPGLEFRDQAGKPRAKLWAVDGWPSLSFRDHAGNPRIVLDASDTVSSLWLGGQASEGTAMLLAGLGQDLFLGGPGRGLPLVSLSALPNGTPYMTLTDKDSRILFKAP